MSKPFPLQPLLNLAQMKNDTATRKLGQLNLQQHNTETQLETLLQYRRDYQDRLQAASLQGMDTVTLRNFQEFIYKLDNAIAQQRKSVEQSKLSTQMGRSEFSNTQRKLKSFDTLHQRHAQAEAKTEAKQEQKATDEHTSRVSAYKMLESKNG